MTLSPDRAIEQATILHGYHQTDRAKLDVVRRYWKGLQALPAVIARDAPNEVRVMARASRVNVLPIVINSLVQSAFVDGFRATGNADTNLDVWNVWQANRLDARQSAIHRAAAAYGVSYSVVLPGTPVPVIRGVSPRSMTTLYGEDPDWPMWALERMGAGAWRLYDEEAVYFLAEPKATPGVYTPDQPRFEFLEHREHGLGVTPVVRFLDEDDLDIDDEADTAIVATNVPETITHGQIAPLMPIQDQIDLTTFDLQISQHYGAFKQRYIIGWAADNEKDAIKHAASTLFTLEQDPKDISIGEWAQTDLKGYIDSREASLRHASTLSQTPVHELTGQLVNLSAEALAAAESSKDRKVGERHTLWGESHEQVFGLVGKLTGNAVPVDAQVIWRDTSARAFAATVDGLGKLATMLGVPPEELWERIPGVTQQDVTRWKNAAQSGDAFANLTTLLDRQASA